MCFENKPPEEYFEILTRQRLTAVQAGYSEVEVPVPSEVFEGESFETRIVRSVICPCGCKEEKELISCNFRDERDIVMTQRGVWPVLKHCESWEKPDTFASLHDGGYIIGRRYDGFTAYELGIVLR